MYEKGFNKFSLSNITEEELKSILTLIYQKYHSLDGLEKSQKEVLRKVCAEIIREFNFADIGNINYKNIEAKFKNEEENNYKDENNFFIM